MRKYTLLRSLAGIAFVLALGGNIIAAVNVEWSSAGFLKLPASAEVGAMSAVAVDRPQGLIYVLHRGGTPVLQFDSRGNYKNGWGQGAFKVPHGLRVDADGNLWITDNGAHTVQKFSPAGKVLTTIFEAN